MSELSPGDRVGDFQIVSVLGRGGMGTVYEGAHPPDGRRVAIKVLGAHVSDDVELSRRFLREAQVVNRIRHPGLVDIFAFGQLPGGGPPYLVMELLLGEPLSERLSRGPLPFSEIVHLFTQVLEALQAAHEAGVIHRDLKPENIWLLSGQTPPQVKLLDFGLAKMEDGGMVTTRAGVTMGTPRYMSPEQCRGAAGIDSRSDLYAVGLLLYEAITGDFPFHAGSPVEMLLQHMEQEPVPPSRHAVLPPQLEVLILRALSKDPARRFGNAREMALALRGIAADPASVSLRRLASQNENTGTIAGQQLEMDKTGTLDLAEQPDLLALGQTLLAAPATPRHFPQPQMAAKEHVMKPYAPQPPGPAQWGAPDPGMATTRPMPKRGPLLIVLIAAGALLSGVGVGLVLHRGQRNKEAGAPDNKGKTEDKLAALRNLPPLVPPDPPQKAKEPPKNVGTLVVDTGVEGAEVSVDGQPRGEGALVRIEGLDPGKHKVTVSVLSGGKPRRVTKKVDVQAGVEVPLQVKLSSRHHHRKGP